MDIVITSGRLVDWGLSRLHKNLRSRFTTLLIPATTTIAAVSLTVISKDICNHARCSLPGDPVIFAKLS